MNKSMQAWAKIVMVPVAHAYRYQVPPILMDVLQSAGAKGENFTIMELMHYIRMYISKKLLFDRVDPTQIRCSNDPLEKAFGVCMFSLRDIPDLLKPKLYLVPPVERNDILPSMQEITQSIREKRKSLDAEESIAKRPCGEFIFAGSSPMYLGIPNSPNYDSNPESVWSNQGYETALCKDSSDDLWFLETDDELAVEVATDDEFEVEYDVVSEASSQHNDDYSDTASEVADIVEASIFLCNTDSDVEFWADYSDVDGNDSSESDPELTDGDKWKCRHCSALNRPPLSFCQKCWQLRNGWLPDRRRPRRHPRRLRRTISAPNGPTTQQNMTCLRERKTSRSLPDFTVAKQLLAGIGGPPSEEKTPETGVTAGSMDCSHNQPSTSSAGFDEYGASTSPGGDCDASQSIASPSDRDDHQPGTPLSVGGESTEAMEPSSSQESSVSRPDLSAVCNVMHTLGKGGVGERESAAASTSTSGFTGDPSSNLCTICLIRPKNASLVHGKTGHQVCCYGCGIKLWERQKSCPVCRRTIQKVIQNFIV